MARDPNAIDFWRGLALITIFINHIPGNVFESFTYSQYGTSDAAELFVFLAGWSIGIAIRGRSGALEPAGRTLLRLLSRMVEVYRAQIVITALALAMLAAAALLLDNPLLLEWHNAGPVFTDPVQTTLGWVTLLHQLGFFNILPLYVVLLGLAPLFVLAARLSRPLALAASLALYLAALVWEINLPSWPGEGHWFFNPLCWQLLLVLGFLAHEWRRESESFQVWRRRLRPLGIAVVVIGAVLAWFHIRPDPLLVPEPRLLFTFDKSYQPPARLIHFIGVLLTFQGAFEWIYARLPWLGRQLAALGRNSLAVFSVGSICSLAAQLVRFWTGGGFAVDVLVVGSGLFVLAFTAWFVEWRSRSPRSPASA
ncbi:OpgC protein [Methylobacterium sp. 4-46]|uniref:OpgC family protein n=1 Tax=unclassified Methylobacterium TaxID=2615210 RepID=UPI000152D56A|nr:MULTISPECIES: OpgC domain-containing protein [Methylobacterium]ACA19725.1 OpgC protein [Methylobacterium sp. 4-46]WFT78917.1 OpgC domain-containing protein [Methylobacterium nodulans]